MHIIILHSSKFLTTLIFIAICTVKITRALKEFWLFGPIDCTEALEKFSEGTIRASVRFLKSLADSMPGETSCISPLASDFLIGALALFGRKETKAETYKFLNLSSRDEIECVFKYIKEEVSKLPRDVEYCSATNLYGNIQYPFTDSFKSKMSKIIGGEAVNINFSKSDKAADNINKRIAEQTSNVITSIIDDHSILNKSTELVAVTGTHFYSPWEIGFLESKEFTEFRAGRRKIIPTDYFHQVAIYNYTHSSDLNAKVLQLYFKDKKFAAYIILPDSPFRENEVIDRMQADPTGWFARVHEQFRARKIRVNIPVIKTMTSSDSRALLIQSTDLKTIYSGETIQTKGIIKKNKPAGVSAGVQTVNFETSYEGYPFPKLSRRGSTLTFNANFPFISFITFGKNIDLICRFYG